MKILKSFFAILFSILFFTSCQKQEKLLGKWERFGDRLAGMTIQVIKEGESFKATIVETTDSCKLLGGIVVGDIKWKNIKNTEGDKYEFEDLGKTQIGIDKFEPSYDLSYLELISNNEIHTRGFSKGTEIVGTEQKWKRTSEK